MRLDGFTLPEIHTNPSQLAVAHQSDLTSDPIRSFLYMLIFDQRKLVLACSNNPGAAWIHLPGMCSFFQAPRKPYIQLPERHEIFEKRALWPLDIVADLHLERSRSRAVQTLISCPICDQMNNKAFLRWQMGDRGRRVFRPAECSQRSSKVSACHGRSPQIPGIRKKLEQRVEGSQRRS
jgi:hypothetical protein